jgi:tRNA G18 (ribose-2'-O)-methylase SpoU
MKKTTLILDNIRSVYNVGSIFRTADAAGVSKIYLCGVTPAPIDRFGRLRKDMAKVALGAEKSVPWERLETTEEATDKLKKEGYEIVAVEQSHSSINFRNHKPAAKTAYIFGNEVEGLSADILKASDKTIEIPMTGQKESLNVSVSVGVVLFNTFPDE